MRIQKYGDRYWAVYDEEGNLSYVLFTRKAYRKYFGAYVMQSQCNNN